MICQQQVDSVRESEGERVCQPHTQTIIIMVVVRRIPSAKMPSTRFAYSDRYNYSGTGTTSSSGRGIETVGSGGSGVAGVASDGGDSAVVVNPRSLAAHSRQASVGLLGYTTRDGIAAPRGVQVSSEEREAILRAIRGEDDDDHIEKTFSRLLVENLLSKVRTSQSNVVRVICCLFYF